MSICDDSHDETVDASSQSLLLDMFRPCLSATGPSLHHLSLTLPLLRFFYPV